MHIVCIVGHQYPIRPSSVSYDNAVHLGARIKPEQQKVSGHAHDGTVLYFVFCPIHFPHRDVPPDRVSFSGSSVKMLYKCSVKYI